MGLHKVRSRSYPITIEIRYPLVLIMKAVEVTGSIDAQGQLFLKQPLNVGQQEYVRVIVLLPDAEDLDEDTPDDQIIADLKESIRDAKTGKTFPISELWEGLDV